MEGESEAPLTAGEQAIVEGKEPPAQEQQQAEQPIEQQPEGEQQEGGERAPAFVPMGELQKERNRRKAEAEKARKAEQDLQRLAGRLDVLQQAWQRPPEEKPQPKELPPVMEAPLDHIEQQGRELAELKAAQRQEQERIQRDHARQQFVGHVSAKENEYRATAPDYDSAIAHLRADRGAELAEAGYPPEHIEQIINGEAMAIAEKALRDGKNPAEVWYKMAARRGYKAAPAKTDAEKLETIERGQQASRSLSQASGAAPVGRLTVESLLKMDDDDFAKLTEKDFRKAMGG